MKKVWESAWLNNESFNYYYYKLIDLAINVFKWENLPDTVDERFLELSLLGNGAAVFFYDDVLGYLALRTMYGGNLDVYNIPNDRRAYAVNGYNRQLDGSNSILIFNNYLRTPSILSVNYYARKLYEIDRTIDVQIKVHKTPVLIKTSEKQRLSLKQLFMKYEGNEPFIWGDKGLDTSETQVLDLKVPYLIDKLQIAKNNLYRDALNDLGIITSNTDKRERLTNVEVEANLGGVYAQRLSKLNARQQACDKINRMFGLDIGVSFRSDYDTSGQLEDFVTSGLVGEN